MELFFFIAGYAASLSKVGSFRLNFGKKVKRLLLPYLVWVTISFLYGLFRGNAHLDLDSVWRYYFVHEFWFLRIMFYVSCIHLIVSRVYGRFNLKPQRYIDIATSVVIIILAILFYDIRLFKYLGYFYIGYGLSFLVRFKAEVEGARHSKAVILLSFLGRESLPLYALHWWLFFKFLPIPISPTVIPQVVYAFIVFVVWLIVSLAVDMVLSKTWMAPYLLGKSN